MSEAENAPFDWSPVGLSVISYGTNKNRKVKGQLSQDAFHKKQTKKVKGQVSQDAFHKNKQKRLKDQSHKMYPFSYSESRFLTGRSEAIYLDM